MKRSIIAAGLAAVLAVMASGCSSEEALEAYKGTDIGGVGAKNDGFFGSIADTLTGGIEGGMGGRVEFAAADMAAPEAGIFAGTGGTGEIGIVPEPGVPVEENKIEPQSGLLTGGEWNDNDHREDWKALYESNDHWNEYQTAWKNKRNNRLAVTVTDEAGNPVEGAKVTSPNGGTAVTDNKGRAYLFYEGAVDFGFEVTCGGYMGTSVNADWVNPNADNSTGVTIKAENNSAKSKKLDLMIMCDTTGSMGDELEYLKVELADIVQKIKSGNTNIPTRISVNFYRDSEDEYEVRSFPFSENINEVVKAIGEQSAAGGGDFPEAVHSALKNAVDGHDWSEDSVKIMFLVLDAPPHGEDSQIVDEVNKYIDKAAETGIRIVPVASSGIDKSTEYLLRVMAMTTGGTYTFLTDDSGIGGGHIEATVGAYNVEKLNDMMVRIVSNYLK